MRANRYYIYWLAVVGDERPFSGMIEGSITLPGYSVLESHVVPRNASVRNLALQPTRFRGPFVLASVDRFTVVAPVPPAYVCPRETISLQLAMTHDLPGFHWKGVKPTQGPICDDGFPNVVRQTFA
jgi:hypothetical protein